MSNNTLEVEKGKIKEIKVLSTVVGGNIAFIRGI